MISVLNTSKGFSGNVQGLARPYKYSIYVTSCPMSFNCRVFIQLNESMYFVERMTL
jgi:hypothetical protein